MLFLSNILNLIQQNLSMMMSILTPLNRLQINSLLHHLPQRTHLPQPMHMLIQQIQQKVHLGLRRKPPNTKPQTPVSQLVIHTQSPKHVTRLQRSRRTRAPRRNRHVLKRHQKTLALHVRKRVIHAPRIPFLPMSVPRHHGYPLLDPPAELIAQVTHPGVVHLHFPFGQFAGRAESGAEGVGESAGAQAALLPSSGEEGFETHAGTTADVEGAYAFGAVDFVGGEGHEVDFHGVYVDGEFA
mmetsp:Transcript_24568/g.44306  ORF Transcript_24568/g.44306 Transcript_24568/m.44306 type:complete len:241 (-) Transcript_24568:117-839(-)